MVATEVVPATLLAIRTKTASPETTSLWGNVCEDLIVALQPSRVPSTEAEMDMKVGCLSTTVTVGSMGSGFCDELGRNEVGVAGREASSLQSQTVVLQLVVC